MNNKKIVDNTYYNINTPIEVINVLNHARINRYRITIDYGDTKTSQSWGKTHNITGYVGRSTGVVKIPLLVYNKRSYGGAAILDDCIIGIYTAKGKTPLYQLNINNK